MRLYNLSTIDYYIFCLIFFLYFIFWIPYNHLTHFVNEVLIFIMRIRAPPANVSVIQKLPSLGHRLSTQSWLSHWDNVLAVPKPFLELCLKRILHPRFHKKAKHGMMLEIETFFKSAMWPSVKSHFEVLWYYDHSTCLRDK